MKRVRMVFLALLISTSSFSVASAETAAAFNDLPRDHWAYQAVNELAKLGIIDGYNDNTFRGDKTMTRYEMAQVVEKAMNNSDKATAKQKALIDKLAVEFALELNKIDTRVKKLETYNKSTLKVGFDTLMAAATDNPPAGTPQIQGNDQWRLRFRLSLSGGLNENTNYNARLTTSFGTAGMDTSSAQNNTISFDRAYFTTKNFLGFDSVRWGRQGVNELGGNVAYKAGNSDGITLTKNLSRITTLKLGVLDVRPQPTTGETGNAQDVKFVSLQSKLSSKLNISGLVMKNDSQVEQKNTFLNYANDGSNIKAVSAAYKLGKWTVLGEYDWANVSNPVNMKENPRAYAFQITNGTVSNTSFVFIPQTVTNINKKGDNAFTVAYRYVEPGITPLKMGSWSSGTIVSPLYKLNGVAVNGQDGIKGWLFDYQYVLAKGIVADVTYQTLKFATTGAKFDNTLALTLGTRF